MVLGGYGAMLAGLYVPGPAWIVLPAAVLAAEIAGGIWGGIPGWLRAQFGASEVISTIMMNYIASSLLLFLLSSRLAFAAPALAALKFVGIASLVLLALMFVAPIRRFMGKRPRLSAAISGVVLLGGMLVYALPYQNQPD